MKLADRLVRPIPPFWFIRLISLKGFLHLITYSCASSSYASLVDIREGQDAALDKALVRGSVSSHNDATSRYTGPPSDYAVSRARHVAIIVEVGRRCPRAWNRVGSVPGGPNE